MKPTLFSFFVALFAASLLADIPPSGCSKRSPGPPPPSQEPPAPTAGTAPDA
ncbi:MAG: hypothetical protein JNJ70_25920 [Verrucomicrobiales bacterium]|nr:hypothetical protein [Verrucomicrobiales bacterium]